MGTAEVGSAVQVFAQLAGNSAVMIGQVNTNSNGTWSVTSSALADGSYQVYALEQHPATPNREAERIDLTKPVVIDTKGPQIKQVVIDRATGSWTVMVQDSLSGLNQATLADSSNYELIKLHTPFTYRMAVTGVSASATMSPTAAQTVMIQMGNGKHLGTGYYVAAVKSGGIADVAGNMLDGEFTGPFPSGDGHPGGNFVALLTSFHHPVGPQPATQFVIDRASRHNPTFALDATTAHASKLKVTQKLSMQSGRSRSPGPRPSGRDNTSRSRCTRQTDTFDRSPMRGPDKLSSGPLPLIPGRGACRGRRTVTSLIRAAGLS